MAQIQIKYVPQQPVWVMYENKPVEAVVNSVKILIEHHSVPPKIEYGISMKSGKGATFREEYLFATKEELKESIFG